MVLQILMCEPYKFPYSRVLFFQNYEIHENFALYDISKGEMNEAEITCYHQS